MLKVEKKTACLSLGITCVEIFSVDKFNFRATYSSIEGSIESYVPTGPEIEQIFSQICKSFDY